MTKNMTKNFLKQIYTFVFSQKEMTDEEYQRCFGITKKEASENWLKNLDNIIKTL